MNYARTIDEIFSQFDGPKFSIKLWDREERLYGKTEPRAFALFIRDSRTAERLLTQGSLGFGESYMEGAVRIEGDIGAYLRLRYQSKRIKPSLQLTFITLMARMSTPHTRKSQIAYHYDLGNDFFGMFLDRETMSYSAGRYESGLENLDAAQKNKLKFVGEWMDLPRGSSVLDLGSGWGGFAEYAAEHFHWQMLGYSLSDAQLNYCRELVRESHLEKRISFEERDMVTNLPDRKFDGVTMIESIEHVGQKRLTPFLQDVKRVLNPGSPFVIQTSGRYVPRHLDRWTQKYVFPGGYLPTKDDLYTAAAQAGLLVEEFRDDTPDYVRTMSVWIKNLEEHRADIEKKFGEPFYRLWNLWMHGAKVNFEIEVMSLFRLRLRRPR
jgi:cyclopropane-fatty-acyl-phospholipid synthase